jgi:hypothetical protein
MHRLGFLPQLAQKYAGEKLTLSNLSSMLGRFCPFATIQGIRSAVFRAPACGNGEYRESAVAVNNQMSAYVAVRIFTG